jgi:hypothetical protein
VRRLLAGLLTASLLSSSAVAAGDSTKQACVQAYVDAQRARKAGKLREARQQLETCADDACPASVKKDCKPWLAENEKDQPSLALSALDVDGKKTSSVRVSVDGTPVGDQLPSSSYKVDPGPHKVRFEVDGLEPVEVEISVQRGEKDREVLADFSKQKKAAAPAAPAAQPATDAARPGRKTPTLVYVLGGVGVLGLASFAYIGSTGKKEEDDLADTCAPRCDPADVDAAHQKLLVADISLGVSAVAFGAAAYLFFTRPAQKEGATRVGAFQVGVATRAGGGAAVVRGAF